MTDIEASRSIQDSDFRRGKSLVSESIAEGWSPIALRDLLRKSQGLLTLSGVESPAQEASWLIQHTLGLSALDLHVRGDLPIAGESLSSVCHFLLRRMQREPLQYILGSQEFRGLDFKVNSSVLIPRPETELLVMEAIRILFDLEKQLLFADIGTGSGCLAIAILTACPRTIGFATDVSSAALALAGINAKRHGVEDRIRFLQGDVTAPLRCVDRPKDGLALILSNPPYIPEAELMTLQPEVWRYEPHQALAGGPDGLSLYRRLVPEALDLLSPLGYLLLEVGKGQAAAVCDLIAANGGYVTPRIIFDRGNIERVISVQKR